jgi:cardiolipin synthase (CMP-forming)
LTDAAAAGTAGELDEGLDRIFTWPNLVTAVRLALIPLYVWLLFETPHQIAAGLLLGTLGATDWIDGYLARRLHQVTKLGKVLDPIADRVLVITAVITIAVFGSVPWWFAGLTLLREVVVSLTVLVLASLGAARIDVLWIGKAGTFALMTAYPWLLIGDGTHWWQHVVTVIAWGIGIIGLALAWAAAYAYVGPAREALANGRRGRHLN